MGYSVINQQLLGKEYNRELIDNVSEQVLFLLKQKVAPEFINRIDNTIMFLPLTIDNIKEITLIQLHSLKNKLAKNEIIIDFEESAITLISTRGYIPEYGGRPIKRIIKEYILDKLSMCLLRQEIDKELPIIAYSVNDEIKFRNN